MFPVTQTAWNNFSLSKLVSGLTWTIWFAGGGGVWIHASTKGTSRNSLTLVPSNSSGKTYPGVRMV